MDTASPPGRTFRSGASSRSPEHTRSVASCTGICRGAAWPGIRSTAEGSCGAASFCDSSVNSFLDRPSRSSLINLSECVERQENRT